MKSPMGPHAIRRDQVPGGVPGGVSGGVPGGVARDLVL